MITKEFLQYFIPFNIVSIYLIVSITDYIKSKKQAFYIKDIIITIGSCVAAYYFPIPYVGLGLVIAVIALTALHFVLKSIPEDEKIEGFDKKLFEDNFVNMALIFVFNYGLLLNKNK